MMEISFIEIDENALLLSQEILYCRFNNPLWEEGIRRTIAVVPWVENRPKRYEHGGDERFRKLANNYHLNVLAGTVYSKKRERTVQNYVV